VHVSDSGQPLIAEALVAPIAPSLASPLPKGRAVDRCAVLTPPQLLALVPLGSPMTATAECRARRAS
jgi:hypothetical protein